MKNLIGPSREVDPEARVHIGNEDAAQVREQAAQKADRRSSCTVSAERSGEWWVLLADDAPGAISQVHHLAGAVQIEDAIAFVTGRPENEIEIEIRNQPDRRADPR